MRCRLTVCCTWLLLLALWLVPSLTWGQALPPGEVVVKPRGPSFVPGELLLQFKPRATANQRAAARALIGAQLAESIHTPPMKASGQGLLERITLPAGLAVQDALRALAGHPSLQFAEVNWTCQTTLTSDDPYYTSGQLWGMYGDDTVNPAGPAGTSNPYGIHAEQAWNLGIIGSPNVIVAVIDEGMQITHPDLAPNIWVNPFETPGDGIDNDGNGYIDDVYGWDFFYGNNSVYDAGEDSHGTHVAGTIGGRGGNGAGVAGVNWQVQIMSLKFLGPNGGSTAGAIKAVDYLVDIKQRHNLRIVACNNSWGGGGYSEALHSSIIRAAKAGILFVAAAGNASANNDTGAYYPCNYNTAVGTSTETAASYDAVISVASITSSGALSSFSSYGSATVDLGAPGSSIYSSVPTDTYASYNGTSMATPHVTGALALYASQNTTASAEFLRTIILNTTTPTASLAGKTVTGGRLNVFTALKSGAYLSLNRSVYRLPDSIQVSLGYPGGNTNPNAVETVPVEVRSTTEGTPETLVLTETGPNTGRFDGAIALVTGTPVADGQLQGAHGNQIQVTQPTLSLTSTATIDANPPVLSALSATATAVSARILWTSDEASSSEVAYGLSAASLDKRATVATPVTSHAVTVSGLAPGTTYYYQVASSDAAGNTTVGPLATFTTTSPAPILFVDDDLGALYERFFKTALEANTLAYDVWDVAVAGASPTPADLLLYPLVIWNTGYEYTGTGAGLTASEQASIASYLDSGGRLFLSGQDILWTGVSVSFRTNYLRLAGYTDDITSASPLTFTGVTGSLLSDGQVLTVTKPSDYAALYVDGLTPGFQGEGLYTHAIGTGTNRHTAVGYRGDYGNGGFGLVFFAFPFEGISTSAADPNNQKTVLRRVLDYLQTSSVPPGLTVSAPTPSATVSESGTSATFTLKLNTRPAADVTLSFSSSDATEVAVTPGSLTFTPANYNSPQTVTVKGVDDTIDDGDITSTIVIAPAVSSDPAYQGLKAADLTFITTDNDTAGFLVSPLSPAGTTEAGGTAAFTVQLATQPAPGTTVTLPLSSSDLTEGTVQPATLTFTPADWNVPQTVTVSGVDDPEDDGNVAYTVILGTASSTDPLYHGINPADLNLVNTNDDAAGIVVSGLSGPSTSESGSSVTFTVKLNSQPLADVSLAISSSDLTEGTVSPTLLTFTPVNWSLLQAVTATGVPDLLVDGNQTFNVILAAAASADPKYNGINPSDMPVINVDVDVAQNVQFDAGAGALFLSADTYSSPTPTAAGTLLDIRSVDGNVQSLTEGRIVISSAKQTRYTSGLEYRWTFPAVDGATRCTLVASRTQNSETDDFQFQYSVNNGATWVNLALVNAATLTTYTVNGLSLRGDVLVRAYDLNRTAASSPTYETLRVDQLAFSKVVTDFRPSVTVVASDAIAREPSDPGQYTFSRSSTRGALTVPLTVSGTAVAGTDYQALPATITFPDGIATVLVTLQPIDDTLINPSRTVVVSIPSSLNYDFQPGNPSSASISLLDNDAPPRVFPASETTVSGTITAGSFASLQALDASVETIAEFVTGGKTTTRQSYLDHRWTFQVGVTPVTGFQLNASRTANSEGDDFRFEYSTNNGTTWTPLATVNTTSVTSYAVSGLSLTGTVLVRVVDTNQGAGKYLQDSVTIDQLYLSR